MGICCAPPLELWEWEAFAREGGWVDLDKCLSKTKSSEFGFDEHFMWVWYANVSVNTFKKLCSSFNDAFGLNKFNYIFVTKKM